MVPVIIEFSHDERQVRFLSVLILVRGHKKPSFPFPQIGHSTATMMESRFLGLALAFVCISVCAHAQNDDMILVFEDDFQGDRLNTSVWCVADNYTHSTYEYNGTGPLPSELQLYTKDEVYVENGNLVLRTRYRPDVARKYGNNGRNYTSGWVESSVYGGPSVPDRGSPSPIATDAPNWCDGNARSGFTQRFGKFQIRAKLPNGTAFKSIWPALWMMPEPATTQPPHLCWPAAGEIDIMESWGGLNNNQVDSTFHWTPKGGASPNTCGGSNDACKGHVGAYPTPGSPPIDFSADFHVWELSWTPAALSFSVDGIHIGTATSKDVLVPQTPFFFIFNTAICGSSWCSASAGQLPKEDTFMYIDSVKVWKLR
eukprot:m.498746 g.498746  ORF g.498746 m.498746 type:complete len:370 (+) comp21822_c0_seq55:96-1205(+)